MSPKPPDALPQADATEDYLYVLRLSDEESPSTESVPVHATLVICAVPLRAFGTGRHTPRLIVAKMVRPTAAALVGEARVLLHAALEMFGAELGLARDDQGSNSGVPSLTDPVCVIEDRWGGFDFFSVGASDRELSFAPVFSLRPNVPARSSQALKLLFPLDAARALGSIAAFTDG